MEFLQSNLKVQLVFEESDTKAITCVSKILDYDSNSIQIQSPTYKGHKVNIEVGNTIEVLVIAEKCVYTFNTSIIGSQKANDSIWLSLPETYRRVQRREYNRVNIKLPITVCFPADKIYCKSFNNNASVELAIKEGKFDTSSIDISGGGFKVFGPVQIQSNSILDVKLRFPMKEITAKAKVIRSEANSKLSEEDFTPEEFAKYSFISAFSFTEIEDIDRSTIIQLCYRRLLELRQRGIG